MQTLIWELGYHHHENRIFHQILCGSASIYEMCLNPYHLIMNEHNPRANFSENLRYYTLLEVLDVQGRNLFSN